MELIGAPALHRRFAALEEVGSEVGRTWAEQCLEEMRARVPVRTGATRESLHLESADSNGARITGSKVAVILDSGTTSYDVAPVSRRVLRWGGAGLPTFRPRARHPRLRGLNYRRAAAEHAIESERTTSVIVDKWNGAA